MKKRAFTLIELLIVIAIVAILVGMVSSAIMGVKEQQPDTPGEAVVEAVDPWANSEGAQ